RSSRRRSGRDGGPAARRRPPGPGTRIRQRRERFVSCLPHFASALLINSYEVPSGSLIFCMYPYSEPSRAFTASTVIWCPIAFAKSARARPTLLYQEGGLLWNVHWSTLPLSPFASMASTICGLIQSTRVRV